MSHSAIITSVNIGCIQNLCRKGRFWSKVQPSKLSKGRRFVALDYAQRTTTLNDNATPPRTRPPCRYTRGNAPTLVTDAKLTPDQNCQQHCIAAHIIGTDDFMYTQILLQYHLPLRQKLTNHFFAALLLAYK